MKTLILTTCLVIMFLVVFGVVYQNMQRHNNNITPIPSPTKHITPVSSPTPTQKNEHPSWKTFTDTTQHITFEYPQALSTTYIRAQTWPPTVTVSSDTFSCKESGQIAGQPLVIQKTIDGTPYCITNMTQGAAGTLYSDYTYAFPRNGKLIFLKFTIAYPQCDNYPDPKKTDCQNERQTFDLDSLIHQIAQTITLSVNVPPQDHPSVSSPQPHAKIQSPVSITGTVPSGWMFEGVFPVKLLDSHRTVIAQTQGKEITAGSWSSGNPVPFTATMNFSTTDTSGFLVLEKDNPSGLPENAQSFEIPVTF